MAYPTQLGAPRTQAALAAALIQMADTALLLDTRAKAIQHAFAAAAAADYEANGAPAGTGAQYQALMTNLATFLGSPAWTAMMQFVDGYRDIGR
jgi:hypothetical protein